MPNENINLYVITIKKHCKFHWGKLRDIFHQSYF